MKKLPVYKKPLLIAEIGINHNGSLHLAKEMIKLAKKYNFDFVKFQKRNPKISTPNKMKDVKRETPWGYISYLEYKKKLEFSKKEYLSIDKFCKKLKIGWFASSWDLQSQFFLRQFKLKYNKVASAMLTNKNLLKIIAEEKKHTFISTGMSSLKDVRNCLKIFKKAKCSFTLMHCVSKYPSEDKDLNLSTIFELRKKFNCDVGYSGHEKTVSPSIIAYMLGATVIERHITLDRTMWGTDQAASLQEEGIKILTTTLTKIPEIIGENKFNKKYKKELSLLKKFKYW